MTTQTVNDQAELFFEQSARKYGEYEDENGEIWAAIEPAYLSGDLEHPHYVARVICANTSHCCPECEFLIAEIVWYITEEELIDEDFAQYFDWNSRYEIQREDATPVEYCELI